MFARPNVVFALLDLVFTRREVVFIGPGVVSAHSDLDFARRKLVFAPQDHELPASYGEMPA